MKITAALLIFNSLLLITASAREAGEIFHSLMLSNSPTAKVIFNECVSGNCVNGRGKKVYTNGDIYEGDFVNGDKEGQATCTFNNGDYYTGAWKYNVRHGYGKYYNKATNITQEGIWKGGNFVGNDQKKSIPVSI